MIDFGHRPLACLVDQIARDEPDRAFLSIPRSSKSEDGWRDITFKQYANAINRVAHRLVKDVGDSSSPKTLAYIGPNDSRYLILILAAIKVGHPLLLISPRNSLEGQLNLFDKTNCNILYYASTHHQNVAPWLARREIQPFLVEDEADWLNVKEVPAFPYDKSFDQSKDDTFAILHTSGSTGLPKPINVKQGAIAIGDWYHLAPELDGRQTWLHSFDRASRLFSPMPLFHAAGLFTTIMLGIFWRLPTVLGAANKPLSVAMVQDSLAYCGADAAFLAPAILEEMSKSSESVEYLKRLKYIGYGGGSLATEAGNTLAGAGILLYSVLGSTEASIGSIYEQNAQDWAWFVFNDELSGYKWKHIEGTDDVYELLIERKPNIPQGIFYTFPQLDEWSTNDLFKKHPTKPHHWQHYGRADNIIVFSTGEKLNPTTIEDYMMGHAEIIGALVVGSNRFQPAILLEPKETISSDEGAQALIERVWPLLIKANKETVAHGQVSKHLILLTQPEKPFPRSGKGAIQRGQAIKLYQDEVEALYRTAGTLTDGSIPKLNLATKDAFMTSVHEALKEILDLPSLEADNDFFAAGVDSMQVLNISRLLRASLMAITGRAVDADIIATRVIYTNPSPNKLAASLYAQVVSGEAADADSLQVQDMQALFAKYTKDLSEARTPHVPPATTNLTVLLTGSTGSLGSYLLADLINTPNVSSVVCLNRGEDGLARQTKSAQERGLTTDFAKVRFLRADLSKGNLGLEKPEYVRLLHDVDRVIHNQWQVNFNLSLASFEPFVRGTRNLVDFAAVAEKQPHITFASTIGTVEKWGNSHKNEIVPESSLSELGLPLNGYDLAMGGYGQSKQVASLILEEAGKRSIVNSAIVRIGQIGGPLGKRGQWNSQEWLPTIIASSAYLGVISESLGMMDTIDWMPTESVAGFLLDLAGVHGLAAPAAQGYYHAVNPHTTHWQNLIPAVREYFGDRIKKQVPFKEWVQLLTKSESTTSDVSKNPAVKLLDFYKGLEQGRAAGMAYMRLDTQKSVKVSQTMQKLEAVKPEWMANWLHQWNF